MSESDASPLVTSEVSSAKTNESSRAAISLAAGIIIANAPDPLFVSDLEGKILQANDAVFELLGFRPAELIEQSLSRIISPEETREFMLALDEVVEHGVTRNAVLNPRSASGEIIPTTLNASALRNSNNEVIGAIGILRDMRELDKARAFAVGLIENAPDPMFVSDLEGKITLANDAVSQLLGFRTDQVVEQSVSRFISKEETRQFTAALREVVEKGEIRNVTLNPQTVTGEIIPTSLNASALRDTEGKVVGAIGILRDMRELNKARAYAESLIKNAPDPVFVTDLVGKISLANDAVSQLLGFRSDEVVEQTVSRFISHEETRQFTEALREVVERGVSRNASLNPRAASGELIPTTLNASALRDTDGSVIGAIGILRDMRAYQEVVHDLEQSKSELQAALRAKDEFLALVSHELRTPVAIIFGNLELMSNHGDRLGKDDQAAAMSDLRSEAARLRRLVENVLALARVDYGVKNEPEPVSLSAIVKQQVERHRQIYPQRPVTAQVTAELPPVESDELSVELVLGNLLANAQKYSPADQPIEITVEVDDRNAVVSVRDRGPGVSVEDAERIFDPFYRSESSGSVKGVGIGLAVCKRLVEAHDGRVWVTPREGGGSDFTFSLPLALEPPPAEVASQRVVDKVEA